MSDSQRTTAVDGEGSSVDRGALLTQFAACDLSRHLALFYGSQEEQLATVSAYLADGIRRGERILYIVDDNDATTITERLAADGIDVESLTDSGQLEIVDSQSVYGTEEFDPCGSVAALESLATEAVESGYSGLRAAGENTWSFEVEGSFDSIVEFETEFDRACPDVPVTALCQYSLDQFGDAEIGRALQAHEQIIYRETLAENPYYTPPGPGGAPDHRSNVELLLEQTRDVTEFRRDVEQREQRLSVVNRVLRHNLRNELNVVLGRADWLRRNGHVDDDGLPHVDTIERVAERLVELSDHARHVDQTLDGLNHEATPVAEVVADAVACVEPDLSRSLDVTIQAGDDVAVDSALGTALRHLLAVVDTGCDGSVTVRVTVEPDGSVVTVTVEAPAPIVPDNSRRAIDGQFEGALQHSPGLRTWIVRWICESVDGSPSLHAADDRGTERITLAVPIVGTNAAGLG
jgi:signal transduction histidine kinase